ncbi:putative integral membrane protein [Theileria parva strain Muguga]|uniref:Uncharacterized protein n=1 Tax=Theileria parva TaxID=5875 RepID=Q4N3U1_THEPA|nr:putative integral membrane protein [Theileria parva strain Muguga]EAN33182.1 putative integral membrane protein [Theileria parva strain Muguga]|eukprot:XP_765465.1 hypothetical protein [Theileria parva strain Muguga]
MRGTSEYSRYETHLAFFMAGLSCMIINSVVDLESYVFLRFLGTTSYDSQTISFFLRRFNLVIGIVVCAVSIKYGSSVVCSDWHWLLFILYFLVSIYIYMLSNNFILVGKFALIPVFCISLVSNGLMIATIKYIFEGSYNKYDDNNTLSLLIFLCGSFTSGLLVKLILQLSGDLKISEDENYPGLKLFNRLFVVFAVITLITSFLISRLPYSPEDEISAAKFTNRSIRNVLYSKSRWVFIMGSLSWSFSPILNNLTLSVINDLNSLEALNLEHIQFLTSLIFTFASYILILVKIINLHKKSGLPYTFYDLICKILKITHESNPDVVLDKGMAEDLMSNNAINIRLFRGMQPWCYLQHGFWIPWEVYDCVDSARLMNVTSVKMKISRIRGGTDFSNVDDDCLDHKTLQDEYLEIVDAKHLLMWEITCVINQCNEVLCLIPDIFHCCEATPGTNCGCGPATSGSSTCPCSATSTQPSSKKSNCCLNCLKNCCSKENQKKCGCFSPCLDKCFTDEECKFIENCDACDMSKYHHYRTFVYGILVTCSHEAKQLLQEISTSPDLEDNLIVSRTNEVSLSILEKYVIELLSILVYVRIADEFLLIFELMRKIAVDLTKAVICFLCKCKCPEPCEVEEKKEGKDKKECKCVCTLYYKFIKCVCKLHQRQNEVCKIILGKSKESLAAELPTLSMTRAVGLFASYFGPFMCSPFLCEQSTCKCNGKTEQKSEDCKCCRYSTRINDLLDMMLKGLQYLSEYDGVLSIIIFHLAYFREFKLEEVGSNTTTTTECTCCCKKTDKNPCTCTTPTPPNGCKCCICCLCCPSDSGGCSCPAVGTSGKKCCICCICCEACQAKNGKCDCCDATKQNGQCCVCCDKCAQECTSKCACCTKECSGNCCMCCLICKKKENDRVDLLKLCENSKKNLELITCTRRCMVVQSLMDYMNKSNLFRDTMKNLNSTSIGLTLISLYFISSLLLYSFCVVGNHISYVRNVPNIRKLKYTIPFFSIITVLTIIHSFVYLSDFGRDSSLIINLMILISMIISTLCSWITQWLTYRILLYNQFEGFYTKFRLIYTGVLTIYQPSFSWWSEGFISFIKTDFYTMYILITLKNFFEYYDPFSFGFTSKLNVNYTMLQSHEYMNIQPSAGHLITTEEFVKKVESVLLDKSKFGSQYHLKDLLNYRAFQHIPKDSFGFLTDLNDFEKVEYSVDMLYESWCRGTRMTHEVDRLQTLREQALKIVETFVQEEVKRSNYDRESIRKLKQFFDFQTLVLSTLAERCLNDSVNIGHKLSCIDSSILITVYELEYRKKWETYFSKIQSTIDEVIEDIDQQVYVPYEKKKLTNLCDAWKIEKMAHCMDNYGSLICKAAVDTAKDEFELFLLDSNNHDPVQSLIDLISSSEQSDSVSNEIKLSRYLSRVSKTGDISELNKIKSEISNLILSNASSNKYLGSLLEGYISVCKSIYNESNIYSYVNRNNEIIIGEWIRWQGQHITYEVIQLLSKFYTIQSLR